MDRIKRLSYEVLDIHKSKFGEDFADNKKILDQISIIRSKGLKNEVAGYITKFIKKEIREEKSKQLQIESSQVEEKSNEELHTESNESVPESKETIVETSTAEETIIETTDEKTQQ
ncbi:MAG: hypothetical protein ACPGQP_01625 [Nitrosopumilus sp.]